MICMASPAEMLMDQPLRIGCLGMVLSLAGATLQGAEVDFVMGAVEGHTQYWHSLVMQCLQRRTAGEPSYPRGLVLPLT